MTAEIHKLHPKAAADHLECPKCHATTELRCDCGVEYIYVKASERAERAVKANPEKSDRAIAEEIGVDHKTEIGRAHV